MAEKGCRDGSSRRPSFRRTISDTALPGDYLDNLEQKRRQLDESIHKYIAAKEREYKVYERDLRQQLKLVQYEDDKDSSNKARSSGSTQTPSDLDVDGSETRRYDGGLIPSGQGDTRQASLASASTRAVDRRASQERDQELVGLFTPAYLPALGNKGTSVLLRTSSEPPVGGSPILDRPSPPSIAQRSNSDPAGAIKTKRPSSLRLNHRTSSSGSSADGKLASAMKSPTQSSKSKRKRVSLAVGDVIVAPSDSVPLALSSNSTPSHSRTRSPVPPSEISSAQTPKALPTSSSSSQEVETGTVMDERETKYQIPDPEKAAPSPVARSLVKSTPKIDPDGDLFDLEDEEMYHSDSDPAFANPFQSENDVVGRLDAIEPTAAASALPLQFSETDYRDDAGLVPEYDEEDEHIDFGPSSSTASQQPTSPGFRRPSVSMDPVYAGTDWERAERDAVMNEVYGSKYTRPGSRGSFTAGSLGESYMVRNAEKLMRDRAGPKSAGTPK